MRPATEARLRALEWERGMVRPDVCDDELAYCASPWTIDAIDEDEDGPRSLELSPRLKPLSAWDEQSRRMACACIDTARDLQEHMVRTAAFERRSMEGVAIGVNERGDFCLLVDGSPVGEWWRAGPEPHPPEGKTSFLIAPTRDPRWRW